MTYGKSNVTCPMTSRDAKWSRLSHIIINYNIMYLLSIRGTMVTTTVAYNKALRTLLYVLQPPCMPNITQVLKNEMSRVCI